MRFENTSVYNIANAIRGMRNPLNSHGKSDSWRHDFAPGAKIPDDPRYRFNAERFEIGPADMDLAMRLIRAGDPHRKFLRQIFVSTDIVKVPSYFMHEFATYKIGTTLDCSSTMHKITSRPLTADDFEVPEVNLERIHLGDTIAALNEIRAEYQHAKDEGKTADAEELFRAMKRMLPHGYLYERMTWTANYEVLANIYRWRRNHRLPAWHEFCEKFVERLPYAEMIVEAAK